jgi:hypothetical protein
MLHKTIMSLVAFSMPAIAIACDETHNPNNPNGAFSPPDLSCEQPIPHNVPEPGSLALLTIAALAAKWKTKHGP